MNDNHTKKTTRIGVSHQSVDEETDLVFKISDRSIQSFFYLALRNHVDLGNFADKKANILLTLGALVFSLLIAKLFVNISALNNEYFIIPFVILIISSVITVVLAVLVTRPKVTEGKFDKEEVRSKNVNLAFFGNFHSMSFEDYNWAVGNMLKENEDIHSTLTKDLYFLGKVLNKKYMILNAAYFVFMTGFALAIITAAIIAKM